MEISRPDTRHQEQVGRVAVLAVQEPTPLHFEGYARSKGSGAAQGAGGAFAGCLSGIGSSGCSGQFCGPVLALMLGICGIAGLVGGLAGAAEAPPASQVQSSEISLTHALEITPFQALLREHVESALRAGGVPVLAVAPERSSIALESGDYRGLADQGVDTVLLTNLREAGIRGAGINAPAGAFLHARVRLVSTRDNGERYAADFLFTGRRMKLEQWVADDGAALLAELERGYPQLAGHIHDQMLRLYPFPDRHLHSAGGMFSTSFGLAPLDPVTRGQYSGQGSIPDFLEWVRVDSLAPTLKWQAFPRPGDLGVAREDMARVAQVSYELLVARETHGEPGETVCHRDGLTRPEHRLENPLAPDARYFWTVRAHFLLDGRPRVTEWSSTSLFPGVSQVPPSRQSYRFRTPGAP